MYTFSNCLLIATPELNGTFFEKKVVYIAEHATMGALGVTVNHPLQSVKMSNLISHLGFSEGEIKALSEDIETTIYQGGPIQVERRFVLYDAVKYAPSTVVVEGGLSLTSSEEILKKIINGSIWVKHMIAFGYSGWDSQQLEMEIKQGLWYVAPFNKGIVFDAPINQRWGAAINSLNVDATQLVLGCGSA